jgi:pimeloyl-ACP methyl ester carboxylesterase
MDVADRTAEVKVYQGGWCIRMPLPERARINGVALAYEEVGDGVPMIFVHEFAGEAVSWQPQVRFFSRRYRTVTFNARGYPPSDVPEDPAAYSQAQAVEDIRGVLDHLKIDRAHVVGLSMGGYATLHFGLSHPERALSLVVAGAGYGSKPEERDAFRRDCAAIADRVEREGMDAVAETYACGPTRVQFIDKDPSAWTEFRDRLKRQSAIGHALTMRGVQMKRPSIYELSDSMARLDVPTLIMTGDEDEPCLEPALFMKRTIPTSALVVLPKSGHTINLEEPEAFNRTVLDFVTTVDAGRWMRRNPASLSA